LNNPTPNHEIFKQNSISKRLNFTQNSQPDVSPDQEQQKVTNTEGNKDEGYPRDFDDANLKYASFAKNSQQDLYGQEELQDEA